MRIVLGKAHQVKSHFRTLPSGKVVRVKEHTRVGDKSFKPAPKAARKWAQKWKYRQFWSEDSNRKDFHMRFDDMKPSLPEEWGDDAAGAWKHALAYYKSHHHHHKEDVEARRRLEMFLVKKWPEMEKLVPDLNEGKTQMLLLRGGKIADLLPVIGKEIKGVARSDILKAMRGAWKTARDKQTEAKRQAALEAGPAAHEAALNEWIQDAYHDYEGNGLDSMSVGLWRHYKDAQDHGFLKPYREKLKLTEAEFLEKYKAHHEKVRASDLKEAADLARPPADEAQRTGAASEWKPLGDGLGYSRVFQGKWSTHTQVWYPDQEIRVRTMPPGGAVNWTTKGLEAAYFELEEEKKYHPVSNMSHVPNEEAKQALKHVGYDFHGLSLHYRMAFKRAQNAGGATFDDCVAAGRKSVKEAARKSGKDPDTVWKLFSLARYHGGEEALKFQWHRAALPATHAALLDALTLWTAGNVKSVRDPKQWQKKLAKPVQTLQWKAESTKQLHQQAYKVLKTLAKVEGDYAVELHRGVRLPPGAIKGLAKGAEIDLREMSSWSKQRSAAETFAATEQKDEGHTKPTKRHPVILTMKTKRGTDISGLSTFHAEHEVVVGGKIQVEKVKRRKDGTYEVRVKAVGGGNMRKAHSLLQTALDAELDKRMRTKGRRARFVLRKASAGPFLGPRGGKWADAEHTRPWKESTAAASHPAADHDLSSVYKQHGPPIPLTGQDGGPLTVYQANHGRTIHGADAGSEAGIYLSPRRKYANRYGPNLHKTHVALSNPKVVENKGEISPKDLTHADIRKLISQGHDGIIVKSPGAATSKASEVVAFSRKSLLANVNAYRDAKDAREDYEYEHGLRKARVMLRKASAGPFLGPRGGKWADAEHTRPWKETSGHAKPKVTPQYHGPMSAHPPAPNVPNVAGMELLGTFADGEIHAYVVDKPDKWFVSAVDKDSGASFFQIHLPKAKWSDRAAVLKYLAKNKKLGPSSLQKARVMLRKAHRGTPGGSKGKGVRYRHPKTGEPCTGDLHASGLDGVSVMDHKTGELHRVEHGHYVHIGDEA